MTERKYLDMLNEKLPQVFPKSWNAADKVLIGFSVVALVVIVLDIWFWRA